MRAALLLLLVLPAAWSADPAVWRNPKDGMVFVRLPAGFWMGRTEVTLKQFRAFIRATGYVTEAEKAHCQANWKNPGFPQTGSHPVVYVTGRDAKRYAEWAGVDLPTVAEWDAASRAGATTGFYFGDEPDGRFLWHRENSTDGTRAVALKLPNAWGLFDMLGNVWEWCECPGTGGAKVYAPMGGAWTRCPAVLWASVPRPGLRCETPHYNWDDDRGFRCIRR